MLDAGGLSDDFIDPRQHGLGALERCGIRQLNIEEGVALVLLRNESDRYLGEAEISQAEQSQIDQHRDCGAAEADGDHLSIYLGALIEEAIEALEEPA